MRLSKVAGYSLILMALTAPAVHADDPCLGDDEKKAALARSAALQKAEQAGQPAALFVAYMQIAVDDCMDRYDKKQSSEPRRTSQSLDGIWLKPPKAKGALYSGDPIRADGQTSAFRYYETIGDHQEANRVLLKAVQAKPEDLRLFETAWNIDNGRYGPVDPNTGSRQPYSSPASFPARTREGGLDQCRSADEGRGERCAGSDRQHR